MPFRNKKSVILKLGGQDWQYNQHIKYLTTYAFTVKASKKRDLQVRRPQRYTFGAENVPSPATVRNHNESGCQRRKIVKIAYRGPEKSTGANELQVQVHQETWL